MDNSGMVEYCAFNEILPSDSFLNIPIDDIDIRRESIPILELNTSIGRESLGILKLGCDVDPSTNNFNLNTISEFSSNDELNQAFLLSPCSRKASEIKSGSTYSMKSSNLSFNIRELEEFSVIRNVDYSNSILLKDSINKLNDGFIYSTELNGLSLYPFRSRFRSLPVYTDRAYEICREQVIEQMMNRVSEGCQKLNSSILKNNSKNEESTFNDSVFIEARHLSTKFSEGSSDDCILDKTDPPALISGVLEDSECDNKCDAEEIFKKIDKLLPVNAYQDLNAKLNSLPTGISKQISSPNSQTDEYDYKSRDCNPNEVKNQDNVIVSMELTNLPEENSASDVEKSKEILYTLSQILCKEDRNEKETEQGQNLLHTLSDMLNNKSREKSKSFTNDSVKSFLGTEQLHSNNTKLEDSSIRSNDSSSVKPISSNRMLKPSSNSFSHPTNALKLKQVTSFGRSLNSDMSNKSSMSNASEPSIEIKNFGVENLAGNCKVKKMTSASFRKGPMKATLSIDNLIKSKPKGTSPKPQQKLPQLNSKISTPIRDVQIRPMAQSTPDNKIANCSASSVDHRNARSFSSPNLQEKSIITSGSVSSLLSYKDSSISKDNSSSLRSHLPRRNSISEGRKSSIPSRVKRSNSMKETSLMKAMSKIRLNISGSSALRDCSNIPAKDDSNIYGKVLNSSNRIIKSFGKENSSSANLPVH